MQLYQWCTLVWLKISPLTLDCVSTSPSHDWTCSSEAVPQNRLQGMVNRLGPEPRLFLLRLLLIHLDTSHFSKEEVPSLGWWLPVCSSTGRVCQNAWVPLDPRWQIIEDSLIGSFAETQFYTLTRVTVMFVFKLTLQHLFCCGCISLFFLFFLLIHLVIAFYPHVSSVKIINIHTYVSPFIEECSLC